MGNNYELLRLSFSDAAPPVGVAERRRPGQLDTHHAHCDVQTVLGTIVSRELNMVWMNAIVVAVTTGPYLESQQVYNQRTNSQ